GVLGEGAVAGQQCQGEVGVGARLFQGAVRLDDLRDVRRQVGGGAADQLKDLGMELGTAHGNRTSASGDGDPLRMVGSREEGAKDRRLNRSPPPTGSGVTRLAKDLALFP